MADYSEWRFGYDVDIVFALQSVILSEAKNLYDCLRDPHLHCTLRGSAVQVSLSLRVTCLKLERTIKL